MLRFRMGTAVKPAVGTAVRGFSRLEAVAEFTADGAVGGFPGADRAGWLRGVARSRDGCGLATPPGKATTWSVGV